MGDALYPDPPNSAPSPPGARPRGAPPVRISSDRMSADAGAGPRTAVATRHPARTRASIITPRCEAFQLSRQMTFEQPIGHSFNPSGHSLNDQATANATHNA